MFSLQVTSATTAPSPRLQGTDALPGTAVGINAGAYSVAEVAVPEGYDAVTDAGCSGTVTVGQNPMPVCTITNTSRPVTVTVTKLVENNWGGALTAASFPLTVTQAGVIQTGASGSSFSVKAGVDFTVGETQQPGYELVSNTCSAPQQAAPGATVVCEITNKDIPEN